MQQYAEFLTEVSLFQGFTAAQITELLTQCGARTRSYNKGEIAIYRGERIGSIGILLSGEMLGQTVTAQGSATTLHHMLPRAVFGDVLSGSSGTSPVTVTAQSESKVLWLRLSALLQPQGDTQLKAAFLRNFIETISDKYFALSFRVELLAERRLRSRIARYLLHLAVQQESRAILLPQQSRAALADFLACERSALSRELSRMRADGLIEIKKRQIVLLDREALEAL